MLSNTPFWTSLLVMVFIQNPESGVDGNKTGLWKEVGNMAGYLLNKCLRYSSQNSQDQFLVSIQDCLRRRSLIALERASDIEVIELSDRISLVKRENNITASNITEEIRKLGEAGGTNNLADWKNEFLQKIRDIFRTHILKIRLNGFDLLQFEGRHRRKGNMMGQLLMFGMIAAGLIVIPMGFQFLAVLGGKALLLAKLALLLTSIQGLKKIATSHMNYGLYSTGHGYEQGPCKDDDYYGCRVDWDQGDDVIIQYDVEDVSLLKGHYDRQWPYELEGYSPNAYTAEHTDQPHTDLLHSSHSDLHPRVDALQQLY